MDRVLPPVALKAPALAGRIERGSFNLVIGLLSAVAIALLTAPTIVVLITSFTNGFSLKFPPPGYSLRWYEALFTQSPELWSAALRSVQVALLATALAAVLAVAAALALARQPSGWARLADSVFMSPLMLPTLALGLALLMTFNVLGVPLSFWTLVIGHVAITTPYILRTTIASLLQLDPVLLQSARSLGAGAAFTFRTVTLPLVLPGVAAGAFIAFMASFDNVAISLFLADARSEMLPIRMWHNIESNLDVRTAAVSGVLIAVTVAALVLMERLVGISRHLK
ncbi:MAG: ABC transporter permease [Burkholderiaceae bacterium]|jgi:putative spermidine/putrescine transport system permease protein|nr:ABC transporter permease [Burkholderiaceae bacterium]